MTDIELNTAVATALGWTEVRTETYPKDRRPGVHTRCDLLVGRKPGGFHDADIVPHFAGSVDACIEAFTDAVFDICVVPHGMGVDGTEADVECGEVTGHCVEKGHPARALCLAWLRAKGAMK